MLTMSYKLSTVVGAGCLVLLTRMISQTDSVRTTMNLSDLVEELLNETRYNSRARPGADTGTPLDVSININVNDISSISEMKMEFSTTLYLRQVWRDDRLAFHHYNRSITLHHKQFDRMWTPDVFIRNLKAGTFHTITVPNRLIRLSPDGTILYSQRLTLTLACDMILNKYPMDNQTCKIEFGSYAYTTEDLVFHWRSDATAVEVNPVMRLPEYNLKKVSHMMCSQKIGSTGSFPCLRAHFHLERRLRPYVLSTFLPSLLVVLLSWVSFWIDLEAAPARISLGILTMLTITTQSSGHLRGMPAVSFTNALDVWMTTCIVFVFGSFLEYSVVNVLARREKERKNAAKSSVVGNQYKPTDTIITASVKQETIPLTNVPPVDENNPSLTTENKTPSCSRLHQTSCDSTSPTKSQEKRGCGGGARWTSILLTCFGPPDSSKYSKALMADMTSRVIFPLMFMIFNLIYWPIYLLA